MKVWKVRTNTSFSHIAQPAQNVGMPIAVPLSEGQGPIWSSQGECADTGISNAGWLVPVTVC